MKRTKIILSKTYFTEYALSLWIWKTLTVDQGLPFETEEVEIEIASVKKA